MYKVRRFILLLLLIVISVVLFSCGNRDPYQELNILFKFNLPEPQYILFDRGDETLSTISLNKSFELQLGYRDADFVLIEALDKWSPLSEPQLNELTGVLLSFYRIQTTQATPEKRLNRLNEYLDTDLKKGDKWYTQRDVVVKGDRLITFLRKDSLEVHAYYLVP